MMRSWMTVGFPGVLARAEEQFAPLIGALPPNRKMFNYTGRRINFGETLMDGVNVIMDALEDPSVDCVCVVAASFGADLIPLVMQWLPPKYDLSRLKLILIDPPAGLDTLCDPMAKIMFGNRAVASTVVGVAALTGLNFPVFGNMLPKPENITVPDKGDVIETAGRNLRGHKASMFASQTALMVEKYRDGSLEQAFRGLTGFDVTIVACTGPQNNVVRQPLAVQRIMQWCPTAKRVDVPRGHCAFLENAPEFRAAIDRIMAA